MSDMSAGAETPDHQGHITGYKSKGYRTYVLIALMLVYTLNFIDRSLMNVVAQPVMNSFNLEDWQFGLLAGPPFAFFYAMMGIPIAMLADRSNRVRIIAVCIILWSLMTVLCGVAAGFLWLLIFRIGVAVGEAGCTPPANSIITDYFPPRSRANAIGIYSMGVTLGGVLAQLFGGAILGIKGLDFGNWLSSIGLGNLFSFINWANVEGWRIAFVLIGAPGMLIALVVWTTIKEPPRGYSDVRQRAPVKKAGFFEAFQEFGRKPTFWTMSVAAAFVAFVGYGLNTFQAPFLQRVHGIDASAAAIYYGAPLAAVAALGTFLGGFLTQKLNDRYDSVVAWLPAVGLCIAIPTYIGAFFAPTLTLTMVLWVIAGMTHYMYLGSQYSIATSIVSPKSRATTVAMLLLIVSLIGNGLGPLFTGWASSFSMRKILDSNGISASIEGFSYKLCGATKIADLGENGPALCSAYAEGLRWSMAATTLFFVIAVIGFYLASRSYTRDKFNGELNAA